jgi:DNA-binding winged helix-turn-helix (wHTH) protein/class 3 adenylate cyclase
MIYTFGACELHTHRGKLRYAGQLRKLEPRVIDVLTYLIRHRRRVVSKHELLDHLWPRQYVSDWAVTRCIREARKAIGCSGRTQELIKTLYGEGYQFIATVEEHIEDAVIGVMPTTSPAVPKANDLPPDHLHNIPFRAYSVQGRSTPKLKGNRKQVAVLSCVFATSMPRSKEFEAEATFNLRQGFFERVLCIAQRYEGIIQQFADQECIVLFGVPQCHPDYARRAMFAAQDIHRCMREYGSRLELHKAAERRTPFPALQVRIGVHAGMITVWTLTSDHPTTYPAMEDTTHLATRLAQHTEPGTTLISEATARLLCNEVQIQAWQPSLPPSHIWPFKTYLVHGLNRSAPSLT